VQRERKAAALRQLNDFAQTALYDKDLFLGYPFNQDVQLEKFYAWYLQSGLHKAFLNNAGDPRHGDASSLATHEFENQIIDFFAPRFGFNKDYWGFVTFSGTDGNAHGVYFGKKILSAASSAPPLMYVSVEAHYSIKKLADVQGIELRLIKALPMGQIDVEDFRAQLDPTRPALVVVAIGTTFKGAIDDQDKINAVLDEVRPPAVYRHADAALFGSILAFGDANARSIVDARLRKFDSIAISGHKFWGLDEPMGLFITSNTVRNRLNPLRVEYLNEAVPTISCSRSGLSPLKLWWRIRMTPTSDFEKMSATLQHNAAYLQRKLAQNNIRAWRNDFSNTVFFQRPSQRVMDKYSLAPEQSPEFGPLAHVVVMQHANKTILDTFVKDMIRDLRHNNSLGQRGDSR